MGDDSEATRRNRLIGLLIACFISAVMWYGVIQVGLYLWRWFS